MPTIAEAAEQNARRISQGGKTGAALVAPTAPNPLLPDPPQAVVNMPSRGVFPASLVLASDLTDSSLVFQRNIVRSRSFPYPPPPAAASTKTTIIQQVATPAATAPASVATADTDFYQTVQQAGTAVTQEPNLNFLAPVTATDNPGNSSTDIAVPNVVGDSGSGGVAGLAPAPPAGSAAAGKYLKADGTYQVPPGTGGAANYQTVQQAGVAKPQEPVLNFLAPITATDNPGNTSTDVAVSVFVASGASHAKGLVPDPGSSAGMTRFLREDATFAVPSGSTSVWTLLESHTASSSTEIDFTTRNAPGQSGATIQSDFDDYIIKIFDVVPATNADILKMQMSTNGGSSYDTSSSDYAWGGGWWGTSNASDGFDFGNTSSNGAAIYVTGTSVTVANTAANGGVNGNIEIFDPAGAATKVTRLQLDMTIPLSSSANYYRAVWHGTYLATGTAINAFRFFFAAGTTATPRTNGISSGVFRCYGISH